MHPHSVLKTGPYRSERNMKTVCILIFSPNVDTRSCPLDRTASLSLKSFKAILAPRGRSSTILLADPRECGYACNQPTLSDKQINLINLLRDYGYRATSNVPYIS